MDLELAGHLFKKMGHYRPLFCLFSSFQQFTVLNFPDDWIQTVDLWYLKQVLCQLSHNHCPSLTLKLPLTGSVLWTKKKVSEMNKYNNRKE